MPEGVDGECACNPATWAAIANAKSVTASGPSSGNASACSRDNSPRLAASRMTPSSGNWVTAIRISDVYHARPGCAMPDKRRTMTFPEILMESLQTGEVLRSVLGSHNAKAIHLIRSRRRQTCRLDPEPGGKGQSFTAVDKFQATNEPRYFYAKVTTTGPLGSEANYTNERYWINRLKITNSDNTATSHLTITVEPTTTTSGTTNPYHQVVTATNWAEYLNGSHALPTGTPVQVWWEYDNSSPNLVRYCFSSGGNGLIPVGLTQTGGSDGSNSTAASWTYTVKTV